MLKTLIGGEGVDFTIFNVKELFLDKRDSALERLVSLNKRRELQSLITGYFLYQISVKEGIGRYRDKGIKALFNSFLQIYNKKTFILVFSS